jgi:hypothetical protein
MRDWEKFPDDDRGGSEATNDVAAAFADEVLGAAGDVPVPGTIHTIRVAVISPLLAVLGFVVCIPILFATLVAAWLIVEASIALGVDATIATGLMFPAFGMGLVLCFFALRWVVRWLRVTDR